MKFIVLSENRKKDVCECEEGFSLYVEIESHKLLFDAGITDLFIKNSKLLDVNLDGVEKVVLSHGHWDHGNGLKYLDGRKTLILHPECFTDRYSISRNMEYGGINQNFDELSAKFNMVLTKEPYEILESVWFLGEIERKNDFEAKAFPTVLAGNETDFLRDDSGIVIKTTNGLIVISGCSHSGICNTIEYAKKVTNEDKICAVIGGFHLKEIDNATKETIKYFMANNIPQAYMGHCTSDEVIEEFRKQLSGKCEVHAMYAGASF